MMVSGFIFFQKVRIIQHSQFSDFGPTELCTLFLGHVNETGNICRLKWGMLSHGLPIKEIVCHQKFFFKHHYFIPTFIRCWQIDCRLIEGTNSHSILAVRYAFYLT